jgi:hypothetical protein
LYEFAWHLRGASPDEIAQVATLTASRPRLQAAFDLWQAAAHEALGVRSPDGIAPDAARRWKAIKRRMNEAPARHHWAAIRDEAAMAVRRSQTARQHAMAVLQPLAEFIGAPVTVGFRQQFLKAAGITSDR